MPLLDLADEILLEIVHLTLKSHENGQDDVHELAATCKRFKRICDTVLWSKYTLVIRLPSVRYYQAPRAGSTLTSKQWWTLFRTRIAHLLSKTAVVRDLTVVDSIASPWGYNTPPGEPRCALFAPEVMDSVAPAIAACRSLTTLHIRSGAFDHSACWPETLWPLIQRGLPYLGALELAAHFADIPRLEGPPKKLHSLRLRWCAGLVDGFLAQNMVFASYLKLTLMQSDAAPVPEGNHFAPSRRLAHHLKALGLEMVHSDLPKVDSGPTYDLSNLPHAQIFVKVPFDCELRSQRPAAWADAKSRIQHLAAGGRNVFHMAKADDCAYAWRPALIDEPDRGYCRRIEKEVVAIDVDA